MGWSEGKKMQWLCESIGENVLYSQYTDTADIIKKELLCVFEGSNTRDWSLLSRLLQLWKLIPQDENKNLTHLKLEEN